MSQGVQHSKKPTPLGRSEQICVILLRVMGVSALCNTGNLTAVVLDDRDLRVGWFGRSARCADCQLPNSIAVGVLCIARYGQASCGIRYPAVSALGPRVGCIRWHAAGDRHHSRNADCLDKL